MEEKPSKTELLGIILKMLLLIGFTVAILSSCAAEVHLSSDPLIVEHRLDLASILPYCQNMCLVNPTPDVCTTNCVNNFLEILGSITR